MRFKAKGLLVFTYLILSVAASWADDPLEYQLAVVDAGSRVPRDHITVARFRSLLDQLSKTFVEDRRQIANMTVKARDILREDGIQEKMLTMMEGMNKLFWKPIPNQKYAEYITMYVMLRKKGESHQEAINDIASFLRSLGAH